MKMEPIIRFAKQSDVKRLVELCQLHAQFEECEYSIVGKEERLLEFLFSENPSLYCLVVELDSHLVGYATYMKQFSTWDAHFYVYMDCLFMTDSARGFGLGEELVNRIKLEGARWGCSHIQWQTPDFNKRAMKFYDRIGATAKSKERYFLDIVA